jgi:hypothetical protein
MNSFLLSLLLLAGFISRFGGAPRTITASLVGTWTLTAKRTVVTPNKGGPATTYPHVVLPNTVKLTYTANGQYTVVFDKRISATGATLTTAGTYSYAGDTITYAANGKTSLARVDTLTSNTLVHVATTQDVGGNYVNVTTSTYIR